MKNRLILFACMEFTIDITVKPIDVYVAGHYANGGGNRACYWGDGALFDLDVPAGTTDSTATGVFVANSMKAEQERIPLHTGEFIKKSDL